MLKEVVYTQRGFRAILRKDKLNVYDDNDADNSRPLRLTNRGLADVVELGKFLSSVAADILVVNGESDEHV